MRERGYRPVQVWVARRSVVTVCCGGTPRSAGAGRSRPAQR
ncbi:MAG TPA: hypothetical protein VET27_06555 [Mycobacterium sp.]|nr:hypothetical protein [Mycobacterium sp.]